MLWWNYRMLSEKLISWTLSGVAILFLAACSTAGSQKQKLIKLPDSLTAPWSAQGRLVLKTGSQAGQATWDLQFQSAQQWSFNSRTGFGLGIVLPFDMPVELPGLPYWLMGRPMPGSYRNLKAINTDILSFEQGRWSIQYLRKNLKYRLPELLILHRGTVRVKILIDQWHFNALNKTKS